MQTLSKLQLIHTIRHAFVYNIPTMFTYYYQPGTPTISDLPVQRPEFVHMQTVDTDHFQFFIHIVYLYIYTICDIASKLIKNSSNKICNKKNCKETSVCTRKERNNTQSFYKENILNSKRSIA